MGDNYLGNFAKTEVTETLNSCETKKYITFSVGDNCLGNFAKTEVTETVCQTL